MVAQTNVVTQHNDIGRTGQNTTETILTQANVNGTSFGKLFTLNVDGVVYAQSLYLSNVTINGTSHRVVFVATEHDSVYAFDVASGTQLWQASLLDAAHGAASGAVPVPPSDSGCQGINQYGGTAEYGITGTPVIDAATGTLYVVSSTFEGTYPVVRLHALDVTTGSEKSGAPVVVSASLPGTGLGSSNGVLNFDPRWQLQRAGLLEVSGNVYVTFASHCDYAPWHGWLMGYDASTLTQTAALDLTPNGYGGGLWMGGTGLSADIENNVPRIFPVTGNGTYDATSPYRPTAMDYGDSILRLEVSTAGSLNVADLFTPSNQKALADGDFDLGGGGAVLLPDQPGSTPHLLATLGKPGVLYLANRDNLGGYSSSVDNVIQEIPIGALLLGAPAYWNGSLYAWPGGSYLSRYPLNNGLLATSPSETSLECQLGISNYGLTPSISSNGTQNGIVWNIDWSQYPEVLYAHNANNVSQTIWSSALNPARDSAGQQVKMVVPTVADGNVFVGSVNQVVVYGLFLAPQTITFPAITAQPGDSYETLVASASSSLGVTFTSTTPTICLTSGNVATLLAPGTCTLVASQPGNVAYSPAPNVSQSFAVSPSVTTVPGPPVISVVSVTAITSTSAIVSWTTDQPTSSLVSYGTTTSYGSTSTLTSTLATSHTVSLTGLTASTTYNFEVVSVNSVGTSAPSTNSTFATLAPPGPPPNVGYVAYWGITNSGITVSWSTDVPANTAVAYGTTAALGQLSPVQTALTANHGVVLTGLNPGTLYYFAAQSTGANGSTGYSTTYSFTTGGVATAVLPVSSPVISNVVASDMGASSVTIMWTTDQPTTSQVNYGGTSAYGSSSTLDPTLVTSHSVTLAGLSAGTTYDYDVVSANSASTSSTSTNYTFATSASLGAPAISNVTATAVGTMVTITWTTDQATTSQVNYGTTTTYGSSSPVTSTLVTSHSVTLGGLSAGTYNYDVVSANSANTSAISANYTITTTAATGPPPNVGYVAYWGITNSGITVSWSTDVPANTAVAYGTTAALGQLSPVQTALTANHGVVLTGLNPGTLYYFAAQSTGANGSTGYSTTYSFTTGGVATAVLPVSSPVISNVVASDMGASSVTIMWTTDQPTTSQVNYGGTSAYGSSSTLDPTLVTSHSVTLAGLSAGTTYDYDVVSANSASTSSTSTNYTFATSASLGAPAISNVTATAVGTMVTITWTTDQATTSQVNYGTTTTYGSSSPVTSTLVTSHSVTLGGLSAGTYNYDVVSANSANTSAISANYTITTTAATGPPPNVGYVAYWGITNSGITVSWSTDVPANTAVAYGTTAALGQLSPVQTALTANHGVVLTGLNPGTLYYFAAQSTGANGSTGYSTTYSFTTGGVATAVLPVSSPVISNVVASDMGASSVTIMWTTDQPTTSQVNYGGTSAYGSSSTLDPTLVTSHSVTLAGLSAGTTYDYDVVSANSASTSSTSTNYTFATSASLGAPAISNVTATAVGTMVTITWTTDQATTSQVNYGTTTTYGSSSPVTSTLVTSHSVTLGGLSAGTYNYDVVSANSANTSAISANYTITTTAATGPPPNVGYVAYWGITNSGITVSWSTDVPANTAVAYGTTAALGQLSPVQTALTANHGVVLTGLNPGTLYYFAAQSTGANGSTGYSTTYSFTTGPALPTISGITVVPNSNSTASVSWTTSVPTSSYVQYGSTTSYNMWSTVSGATTNPQLLLPYVPGGLIHYQLVSTDANGNQVLSPDYTFTEP